MTSTQPRLSRPRLPARRQQSCARILGWGDQIRQAALRAQPNAQVAASLQRLDLNKVWCGTIDSLEEEVLTQHRGAGQAAPVIIEEFVAAARMLRSGLFDTGLLHDAQLGAYVGILTGQARVAAADTCSTLLSVRDRFTNDQVNVPGYVARVGTGATQANQAIAAYQAALAGDGIFDFAGLQDNFLNGLTSGRLQPFLATIRHVLVDEYQDTNLSQERVYFALAQAAIASGGSFTVVGDDDQSLYRFRGATVDLFHDFVRRAQATLRITPTLIYLSQNYRSTRAVVDFVNTYVALDADYQPARVAGKPPIGPSRGVAANLEVPVLGIFRDDVGQLATALGDFIHDVVRGPGRRVNANGMTFDLRVANNGGSAADIAVLLSSPREYRGDGTTPRLPLLLRQSLAARQQPIPVFNPRGQNLCLIQSVQMLCGLILECIDPAAQVEAQILRLPNAARASFNQWRAVAQGFIRSQPGGRGSVGEFVQHWQRRQPLRRTVNGRMNIGLNELIYSLVTWLPPMQQDVEHLAYLECVTRAVSQSAQFSSWGGSIVFEQGGGAGLSQLEIHSVKAALWEILTPIAMGAVDVNEDLLDTLPRDRVPLMSIHQAKGLEFPMTIVDIGSDFTRNHAKQAFKRFPANASPPCVQEDEFRADSPLGLPQRPGLDRSFDDLIRQYFVAFSRAADVLVLVGTTASRTRGIANIAAGFDRRRNWHWGAGLPNLLHI